MCPKPPPRHHLRLPLDPIHLPDVSRATRYRYTPTAMKNEPCLNLAQMTALRRQFGLEDKSVADRRLLRAYHLGELPADTDREVTAALVAIAPFAALSEEIARRLAEHSEGSRLLVRFSATLRHILRSTGNHELVQRPLRSALPPGHDSELAALLTALKDSRWIVRAASARALQVVEQSHAAEVLDALLATNANEEPLVRRSVLRGLAIVATNANLRREDVKSALIAARDGPDPVCRESARQALDLVGSRFAADLEPLSAGTPTRLEGTTRVSKPEPTAPAACNDIPPEFSIGSPGARKPNSRKAAKWPMPLAIAAAITLVSGLLFWAKFRHEPPKAVEIPGEKGGSPALQHQGPGPGKVPPDEGAPGEITPTPDSDRPPVIVQEDKKPPTEVPKAPRDAQGSGTESERPPVIVQEDKKPPAGDPKGPKNPGSPVPPGEDPEAPLTADTAPAGQNSVRSVVVKSLFVEPRQGRAVNQLALTVTESSATADQSPPIRIIDPTNRTMAVALDVVHSYLSQRAGGWPKNFGLTVEFEQREVLKGGNSCTLPLALAAESLLRKIPLDDVAVTGNMNSAGNVLEVGSISEKVRFADAPYVLVPHANWGALEDAVVLYGAQFLLDRQIIGCANFDDAWAAAKPMSDRPVDTQLALNKFKDFQQRMKKKIKDKSTGTIIEVPIKPEILKSNKAGQDQLVQILKLAPNHFSAKLLLAYATSGLKEQASLPSSYAVLEVTGAEVLDAALALQDGDGGANLDELLLRAKNLVPLVAPEAKPFATALSNLATCVRDLGTAAKVKNASDLALEKWEELSRNPTLIKAFAGETRFGITPFARVRPYFQFIVPKLAGIGVEGPVPVTNPLNTEFRVFGLKKGVPLIGVSPVGNVAQNERNIYLHAAVPEGTRFSAELFFGSRPASQGVLEYDIVLIWAENDEGVMFVDPSNEAPVTVKQSDLLIMSGTEDQRTYSLGERRLKTAKGFRATVLRVEVDHDK